MREKREKPTPMWVRLHLLLVRWARGAVALAQQALSSRLARATAAADVNTDVLTS